MKIKIGIIFGGSSREREISFAGGRTVYDNLNKTLFEPVPVFVDSFNRFILLDWHFIYKGSIRDFYPPVSELPISENDFQVYAESLQKNPQKLSAELGRTLEPSEFRSFFDFAFLCLHGTSGEDGRIQGLLEYYGIPYSGSGIFSSAMGMNKAIQKDFMRSSGFDVPAYSVIKRDQWISDPEKILTSVLSAEFPVVVKAANQGSSIGISVVQNADKSELTEAINKSFFIKKISASSWSVIQDKVEFIRSLSDIREGLGMPLQLRYDQNEVTVYHPEDLLKRIQSLMEGDVKELTLIAVDSESEVLTEGFIHGKEFSCIVVEDENREPLALPPTEIRKGREVFDYRSKYLPGLSRKITPINIEEAQIEKIRTECSRLFRALKFSVYARIDGFIREDGRIFLNDPNTTSGMMPSSFFFHQAAEIGLNPSQFLTYIIHTSLKAREHEFRGAGQVTKLRSELESSLLQLKSSEEKKTRVGVIFGGYSSERHISVESGRNIFEKLASSGNYHPVPLFLTGGPEGFTLYKIPINLVLKDNADDIREKILHYHVHPVIHKIITSAGKLTDTFSSAENLGSPEEIDIYSLKDHVDAVFIALHGRPGEDGHVQRILEEQGIPFNGSRANSSNITINKYETNEILMKNGFLAARHALFMKEEWLGDRNAFFGKIESGFAYPFIAKPVDDGCSSAVRIIHNRRELEAFSESIFRNSGDLSGEACEALHIKPKEEFPCKNQMLIEELITAKGARKFLEITGGFLTRYNADGELEYEMFEPSEALSEGEVLSLEEKFLAGEGQNITPARYAADPQERNRIAGIVKDTLKKAAMVLNVEGYARIDAFVRIYENGQVEVIFVEVNSLPGMTPATCIFHQSALNGYKPYQFIESILKFGFERNKRKAEWAG